MKRHLIALVGALAVLLVIGSGAAQAQSVQGVEQVAGTGQSASSSATSTQTAPSNSNISVRIFSPGENGSVSQSNNSAALSGAVNKASTSQGVTQSGSGAGPAEQAVGQVALTGQKADSKATSEQYKPSNSNISVRIHSPGKDGNVEQSNNSLAGSLAANKAETDQTVDQKQDGCGCPTGKKDSGSGAGVQAVGQKAVTLQGAKSEATSKQYEPSNSNLPVRIGSYGENGSVEQSNSSKALSLAGNLASTTQTANQSQSDGCGCAGDRVQAVGQFALTGQKADSDATSIQKGAKNLNAPVRIHSDGGDGKVEQSNNSGALSAALNAAETTQTVDQRQSGCGCPVPKKDYGGYDSKDGGYDGGRGGARVQAVGQIALTGQKADSDAKSLQFWPSNTNAPVREKSYGGGGSVNQSNNSFAGSLALNLARTNQWVRQQQ